MSRGVNALFVPRRSVVHELSTAHCLLPAPSSELTNGTVGGDGGEMARTNKRTQRVSPRAGKGAHNPSSGEGEPCTPAPEAEVLPRNTTECRSPPSTTSRSTEQPPRGHERPVTRTDVTHGMCTTPIQDSAMWLKACNKNELTLEKTRRSYTRVFSTGSDRLLWLS